MRKLFIYIRVLIRAPIALMWTLLIHWFLIRIPQLFHKRRYTRPIGIWGRGLAFIMGVRIHKLNERSGPMGDIVISNHMGFLDVPVLLAHFPSVFIIKMEMRRVFYFGKALENQGHVFVQRDKLKSRHSARDGLMSVLKDGDRIIVFPEGRASPGAERLPFKPFSFAAAQRRDKLVEPCVIDYLPNRDMLKWDINRPMVPQLIEIIGRRRTDISIEFLPAEKVDDPREMAQRYHDLIQGKLEEYDRKRAADIDTEEP
ncbi:MAG: 1-acyl-sn-glycerol-3-phosphate acyltransferase [Deltaproteobacteria bacterium]|nr:1-acyl-sn-glycerol-3-phosphate acyltransferase [Deltaproteobacteria bacterium]